MTSRICYQALERFNNKNKSIAKLLFDNAGHKKPDPQNTEPSSQRKNGRMRNIDISIYLIYFENMDTITLSKEEYDQLVRKALYYDYLHQLLKEDIFACPPTKKVKKIIDSFAETGAYNENFLKSLEKLKISGAYLLIGLGAFLAISV